MADYDTLLIGSTTCVREPHDGQDLQEQAIRQHCKALRMPTIGGAVRPSWPRLRPGRDNPMSAILRRCWRPKWRSARAGLISRLLHEARAAADEDPGWRSSSTAPASRPPQLRTLAEGDYVTKAEPDPVGGRGRYRQDPSGDRALCGRLSAAAAGAVHDCHGTDQRVGRGRPRQPTQPRARADGNGST